MSLEPSPSAESPPPLKARRIRLYTQYEPIVLMSTDSHVCRAEGLAARSQVRVTAGDRHVHATLFQIDDLLAPNEVALSEAAWTILGVQAGDSVCVSHPPTLESLSDVRRRIYGQRLDHTAIAGIIRDVVAGHYTEVHLAAFLTANAAFPMDEAETVDLTRAMVETGDRLSWPSAVVMDKHCIGGLPGNRTTPIVVAIVAACGLMMPKTSSRAITSPAGTADAMETLAPVDLDVAAMRRVVEAEGGCIAWGGSVRLSPADDIFIQVERALDVDAGAQLVASVLSKKIAAGATHLVLDIPVGPTAKVRSERAGRTLADRLETVASQFGLKTVCLQTDGTQPVGRGVGPALEAADVVAVLRNDPGAPDDLRRRSCALAAAALELGGAAGRGEGQRLAEQTLATGRAWSRFQRICEAQGGLRVPPRSKLTRDLNAAHSGRVEQINNRKIARLAKLAGAPETKAAGLVLNVRLGDEVATGQPLLTVHADTPGELRYALDYAAENLDLIGIGI